MRLGVRPLEECELSERALHMQEVIVKANKRKSFPNSALPTKRSITDTWESIPAPMGLLRKQAFIRQMEATFDASAARQAWKESQRVVGSYNAHFMQISWSCIWGFAFSWPD